MIPSAFGDLAQSFVQRQSSSRLTQEMTRLGKELTTGLKSNVGAALSGDTRLLAGLERSLTGLDAYRTATAESRIFADATQAALERITTNLQTLQPGLLAIQTGSDPQMINAAADGAREGFLSVISSLNTQVSGRSLFAGTDTEGPAVRAGTDILADLTALVSGAVTAADVATAIDTYFSAGNAFDTNDYLGSAQSRAAISVSPNDEIALTLRADDADLRDTLVALAKSAVLAEGALAGDGAARARLARQSGVDLLNAERKITGTRGTIGTVQARIEAVETRNETERSILELSRSDMMAADPFETASRIEQVDAQLQSLYTITARMSRLNLASYL